MSQIITVASGKGGTGKSTFCANIALALSEKGKRVLLIDGDAGLRSLDLLLGVDEIVVYDWLDVIEKRCNSDKALLFYDDRIRLLPAPLEVPEKLTSEDFAGLIGTYEDDFDYIFIDSPAGIGELTEIYAKQSEKCIIIATPDEVSARSAYIAGNELIKNGADEKNLRLVINRFDKKAVKKGRLLNLDEMVDKTYLQLLGVIPEEPNLRYVSVTEKQLSSTNDAKRAFSDIAERINGKEISLFL